MRMLAGLMMIFLLTPSFLVPAQGREQNSNPNEAIKSCGDFVQDFYDWYVRQIREEHFDESGVAIALKYRLAAFSPELSRRLKEDMDASASCPGEICGLDFDPFLNSQDPDEKYVAGKVSAKGGSWWAEVYSVRDGKRSEKPDVVCQLARDSERWYFVNFHYGNIDDPKHNELLGILKSLREERERAHK